MGLKRIRRKIRERRYELTIHALEEMDEDNLDETDVRNAVLHGIISAELTDDPRGTRFVVRGTATDEKREIEVVCRFLAYNYSISRSKFIIRLMPCRE